MRTKINNIKGQTALILILLSAAALIFLAIAINWGKVAQSKNMLSIAANQSAALLASEAASYGQMLKQTNLDNTNEVSGIGGILFEIIAVVLAIVVAIWTGGTALSLVALAFSVSALALQLLVIQPGLTSLWNRLQQNQPIKQQFFEQGIVTALQGAVTDQATITDYLDMNANTKFGGSVNAPNDTISRFALFYMERLKMLNRDSIPQVDFFYNQLGAFMNGKTCAQDFIDNPNNPDPRCKDPLTGLNYCGTNPSSLSDDPACHAPIVKGFQLNDSCLDGDPSSSTYNPYCDPCCQPVKIGSRVVRPTDCPADVTAQCSTNNPYGAVHPWIYDASYQNYGNELSFLSLFGRDQQRGPFSTTVSPQGNQSAGVYFPNGLYPFFWMTENYSLSVKALNPGDPTQAHWCANSSAAAAPEGFTELEPLTLPYACQGNNCCVNYLANNISNGAPTSGATTNGTIDLVDKKLQGISWIEGDSQFCRSEWPYNDRSLKFPDGKCQADDATIDDLDRVMHIFSGFTTYAKSLLDQDLGTLVASFDTWYPGAAHWIAPECGSSGASPESCNKKSQGRLREIYDPLRGIDVLLTWDGKVTQWLRENYTPPQATSATVWCVPTETALLQGNNTTDEHQYIKTQSTLIAGPMTTSWGDLPHVIACLNYNAGETNLGPVFNYQRCLDALSTGTCPSSLPEACSAPVLGRSLAGNAPSFDGCGKNYEAWVNKSLALATNESPKFALRAAFLTSLYTKAQHMHNIFSSGSLAMQNFFKPCGSSATCADGGPVAQLMWAREQEPATRRLPNSVIYGWTDEPSLKGKPGNAHIVKVTAFSPGRNRGSQGFVNKRLPWIEKDDDIATTSYELQERDGNVYVSIQRWDQNQSSPIRFPNGKVLWQFMSGKPSNGRSDNKIPDSCKNLGGIAFGISSYAARGLQLNGLSSQDSGVLSKAFMLNDDGSGQIDDAARTNPNYANCITEVNDLLKESGIESKACARYVATSEASQRQSDEEDGDYTIKFVECKGNLTSKP